MSFYPRINRKEATSTSFRDSLFPVFIYCILLCSSPIHAIHRRINRYISPIHKTAEVATKIYTQSFGCKGVTLNNAPPKLTIKICPAKIMRVTHRNPLHEANRSKADCTFPKAFALNIFQNCKNTNMEKKRVSSYRVSPPGTGAKLKKWVKKSDRSN